MGVAAPKAAVAQRNKAADNYRSEASKDVKVLVTAQ